MISTLVLFLFLIANAVADCNCNARFEYCDEFVKECRMCRDICGANGNFKECEIKCEPYLKERIFSSPLSSPTPDDIKLIQILLAVVTAISSVILVLLLVLVTFKVKGKKRKEQIEVLPMSEFQPDVTSSPNLGQVQRRNGTVSPSTLQNARSMQTVTTQLSEETSHGRLPGQPFKPIHKGYSAGSSTNGSSCLRSSPTCRIPSEDRAPDAAQYAYENRGMISSPSGSSPRREDPEPADLSTAAASPVRANGNFPAIPNGQLINSRPYTISHSKV